MHAIINKASKNGRSYYQLVCADHYLCDFFSEWSYSLAKKQDSFNTVETYARGTLRFINYYLEAVKQFQNLNDLKMIELLDGYESYLAFGVDSEHEMAKSIATALAELEADKDKNDLSGSSIENYITGLNSFLSESEAFRKACLILEESGVIDSDLKTNPSSILRIGTSTPTEAVKKAVRNSSWFSACLAGGMKSIKHKHLKPKNKPSEIIYADEYGGDDKTFPLDKAVDFINSAPNPRDKALWALLAATGARISEALTMQRSDIDIKRNSPEEIERTQRVIKSKTISIIDPNTRTNVLKKHIPEKTLNELPHKGRASPETYLIEPFASLFWVAYDEYLKFESEKNKRRGIPPIHPFLFSKISDGEPLVTSYKAVWKSFNEAAKLITGKSYGPHSLRHMYGYYLHNFAPKPDGSFGLSLKSVQMYMGHSDIKNTQRYARQDHIMLEASLSAINMTRSQNTFFNVQHARLAHLERLVEETKAAINDKEREHD